MLKNILFAVQTVGPAERIAGARRYLGRSIVTEQDIAAIAIAACIVVGFALLVIFAYIKQLRNKK